MKADDAVFSLVHSLTGTEKRFFKRFGNPSQGRKDHLTLFTLIENQKAYDENAIKAHLKKQGIAENISWSKNYLTGQILLSLRTFHSESWPKLEAIDLIKSVEILFRKMQYKTCMKLIRKGIEHCTTYELWSYHLEFISFECNVMIKTGDYKNLASYRQKGMKEKSKLTERISLLNELAALTCSYEAINNTLSKHSPKEIAAFTRSTILEANRLLKKAKGSYVLSEGLLVMLFVCHGVNDDYRKELPCHEKLLKLLDDFPQFRANVPVKYYLTQLNYVYCLNRNAYWEKALIETEKLQTFLDGNRGFFKTDVMLNSISAVMRLKTTAYLGLNEEKKALESTLVYEGANAALRKNLRRSAILNDVFFLSRVYFRNGVHDKCKKALTEILAETNVSVAPVFMQHAYFLRLCLDVRQEKWENVLYFIPAAKKVATKSGIKDAYAVAFIELMKELAKRKGEVSDKEKFRENVKKMEKLIGLQNQVNTDLQFFLFELAEK